MFRKYQAISAIMALVISFVGACVTVEQQDQDIPEESAKLIKLDREDVDLIAENFVHTLSQLDGLSPIPTTIQMSQPTTPFGRAIEKHVIDAGYGHQLVDGDMGLYFLRYRVVRTETQAGYTRLFRMIIGDIALEREFQNVEGHLTPVSAMRIKGSRTNQIRLNDDIFRFNNPNLFESRVEPLGDSGTTNPPLVNNSTRALETPSAVVSIGFEQNESQYAESFVGYLDIVSQLHQFSYKSRRISTAAYNEMREIIEDFNPDTDLISILGCSLGNDASQSENKALAKVRATRVKRALIRSGIGPNKIFDESCWDISSWDANSIRRAVILTHKRLAQVVAN